VSRPSGPLAGVRVLDLTTILMGPYATQILGDLGADVIKVEAPQGDAARGIVPRRNPGMGANVLNLQRNKRSVVLDIAQPAGRDALLRLARTADVFVHNLRPQPLARLGIGYDAVRAENPRVVYCSARGYGEAGPYGERAAYDDLIQGASGLAALVEKVHGAPGYLPTVLCDKTSGLTIVYAVLAALFHRERTGEGQAVEVPMFETMVAFNLVEHLAGHAFEPPLGEAGYPRLLTRFRRPFRTRDGYVCLLPYTDRNWRDFFELAGRPELRDDPRFRDIGSRTEHSEALYATVAEAVAARTTAEWLALCDRVGIPAGPLLRLDDLWDDPHLRAVGLLQRARHPSEGDYWSVAPPVGFSSTPAGVTRHAPRLGEHSVEVLLTAGYSPAEVNALIAAGVTADGERWPDASTG
jgi:crotonobetainyl-CoA:carnitine CoA-transferase CaiB-like acyl-CoA transferase